MGSLTSIMSPAEHSCVWGGGRVTTLWGGNNDAYLLLWNLKLLTSINECGYVDGLLYT